MSMQETTIKTVLFVDDDANIRLLGKMSLEGLTDWKVELAESGALALERAQAVHPDVILLDIMMPIMDGVETYRRMQEIPELRSIPTIFFTAKVQTEEVERYRMLGAAGVISKPFDPLTLHEEIIARTKTYLESQHSVTTT